MFGRMMAVLVPALLLLGCTSKINEAAYKRVKRNMSLQEVEGLLGPGIELSDDEMLAVLKKNYESGSEELRASAEKLTVQVVAGFTGKVWREGKRSINVFFRDERVQQIYKEGF